jgi:hypothetical protein
VRRALAVSLVALCLGAALGCGKYGPPVRADRREQPAEPEGQEEKAAR